jgi:hypothetical protein
MSGAMQEVQGQDDCGLMWLRWTICKHENVMVDPVLHKISGNNGI